MTVESNVIGLVGVNINDTAKLLMAIGVAPGLLAVWFLKQHKGDRHVQEEVDNWWATGVRSWWGWALVLPDQ
jgi:hypothetical protein